MRKALVRINDAPVPGGAVVVGLYPRSADPLGRALAALRLVRDGGHPWELDELALEMEAAGFVELETSRSDGASDIVLGTRPR